MKNNNLIKMLSESLSVEEIPMISNLEELRDMVNSSNLDSSVKAGMIKRIEHLIKDTLLHGKIIAKLIRDTANELYK